MTVVPDTRPGVLSRLAQCPQPLLHTYLFGQSLNSPGLGGQLENDRRGSNGGGMNDRGGRLKQDVRTLVGVLQQVGLVWVGIVACMG